MTLDRSLSAIALVCTVTSASGLAAAAVPEYALEAAQQVRGQVRGQVLLADGVPASGVAVTVRTTDGTTVASSVTDPSGRFEFTDLVPGAYTVVASDDTLVASSALQLHAGVMPDLTLTFGVMLDAAVLADTPLSRPGSTRSGEMLRAQPVRMQSRALPQALATMPGWAEEDNGLLHVRGVDDGVLYVEDGVPIYDRLDVAFGVPPSLAGVGTVTVTTGHTPAEFGLKSGSVVHVSSPPAQERWSGDLQSGSGSSALGSMAVSTGGRVGGPIDVHAALAGERSDRFLDPVHPDNLHNTGGVLGATLRARARLGRNGQLTVQGRSGRSRFEVPHGGEADDAGQDQRQRIAQHGLGSALQQMAGRSWLSAGLYGRRVNARLDGSANDTPVAAASDRTQTRGGLLASLGRTVGGHMLTVGGEIARVSVREDFSFAVTDPDADDLSDSARAFTPARPFVFADEAARTQVSAFVQDRIALGRLTVDAGLRFDRTSFLVTASQWSPRIGTALDLPALGATLRASFNRFFQPPQAEHLLLASSEAARVLSPFADEDDDGGADVAPERQSAWEVGFGRWFGPLQLDLAGWHRSVENYADPNVFFGTTIVFPNSVAKGTARGLDVRLALPSSRGWTASASYSLSKVEQEGPINGGLFLEDEIDEIGPGVVFTPDHDQRHVAAAAITWVPAVSRWSASAQARYASGTPLEVGELDDDDADELAERPGAELIDLERGRVRPRLVVDVSASARLVRAGRTQVVLGASVLNAFDRSYAFNFGNPFSGTHFGAPRQFRVDLSASFR